jgi:uncharacterized protein
MTKIGLLSDTHGYLDPQIETLFAGCDEIWHAGDIGSGPVLEQLRHIKPVRAVYGNIDSPAIYAEAPEHQRFVLEGLDIWMTHIGGTPPRYNPFVKPNLELNPPHVFICGHSHILKVSRDAKLHNLLFINPGAAGRSGFHLLRTCLRFALDAGRVLNMEVIELGKR